MAINLIIWIILIICLIVLLVSSIYMRKLLKQKQKYSGILHITETDKTLYYTIEITDDLESIPNKKDILLKIHNSHEKHTV